MTRILFAAMLMGASLATMAVAQAAPVEVMEFSGPAAGHEADFDQWYVTRHVPAVLKAHGVKTVQRYRIEQPQRASPYPAYILVVTADGDAISTKQLEKLLADGGEAVDKTSALTAVYAPMGPRLMAKDVPGTTPAPAVAGAVELKTFHLMAFVNAQPDHEAEFNKGYSEDHFPDVIRNPGVQWGQRSKLVSVLQAGAVFPGYLADYEYAAYDIPAANAEVNRRLAEHITRPIPFPAPGGHTWYAEPIGPVLTAK